MLLATARDLLYITSPLIGFLPQMYRKKIVFSPVLSLLSIISCVIKIFQYQIEPYSTVLLYQFVLLVGMHFYLIKNYRLPLRRTEHYVYNPRLYSKYGLATYASSVVVTVIAALHVLYFMGGGWIMGHLASATDIFTTVLQMAFYRNNPSKPRELFLAWIVGDIAKMFIMLGFYEAPRIYLITTAIQLAINTYVLVA
ncbi:hypothetical protein PAPHI01_2438 [Pancytospora philotis]|nr:hypothetical protein PAPHI01_2438 [Pancytospora philotis]